VIRPGVEGMPEMSVPSQRLFLFAFPRVAMVSPVAVFVRFQILIASAVLAVLARAAPVELTRVAEVRAMSRADEFVKHAVRLRGVLLSDPPGGLFLQDDTGSIWVNGPESLFKAMKRGDHVEVRGTAAPGHFAPIVEVGTMTRLGTGPILPPARVTFRDLDSGRYDAQWVEIEGIVRRVAAASSPQVVLESGGGRLPIFFPGAPDAAVQVDSKIRVTGIALLQFTRTGQTIYPLLSIPKGVRPTVVSPPPAEVPLRRIDRLMAFSDKLDHGHRVRIHGVVTHVQPGEAIWLEWEGHGIRVNVEDSAGYPLGEEVEVLGFPVRRQNYSPEMEDVVITRLASGKPRTPVFLESSLAALDHDAGLIALEAEVVEIMRVPRGLRFVLRDAQRDFIAHLDQAPTAAPHGWQTGSLVRATGICSVSAVPVGNRMGTVDPREFELLVRSPADIQVLQTPPWWNAERRSWLLAALSAVLGLTVFGIVRSSRRKLRQAAAARRQSEVEFAAILSERGRIAREIHDTLAQGLGAISLHLDMMKEHVPAGSKAENHLLEATDITRDCLSEARHSIWNMRSQAIEEHGLDGALAGVFDQLTDIDGLAGDFEVVGEPFRLPPVVENNLLRIGQEAVTNAVKHASAKRIAVTLAYSPHLVTLRVKDDGRGFDPANIRDETDHFGLLGLKERADEIGATLRIDGQVGRGTEVTLEYPIQSASIGSR
jgi:signal transduction histidine kinase